MKQGLHKMFGSKNQMINSEQNQRRNDAFAEMLFRYISNCTEESLETSRINYYEFLNKLDVVWPKKSVRKPGDSSTKDSEEQEESKKQKEAC